MHAHTGSHTRLDDLSSGDTVGPSHPGSSTSLLCTTEQPASMYMSCHKESTRSCSSTCRDWQCPVCLQTASFPVQTNCGHLFCAPCLMAYWKHGSWLDAISCPLCRQKVSVLCNLFNESRTDHQSKEVLGEITSYNKRYSGAPRRMTDYLCDAPLLLVLLARAVGTMEGLVWLFFLRVFLCCVGTAVSISAPPLPDTDPSLCGLLGVLDDLVVVVLLVTCVLNINQQMAPERGRRSANVTTTTQEVMVNSLWLED